MRGTCRPWSSARGSWDRPGSSASTNPAPTSSAVARCPTWYDRGAFAAALAGQDIDRESAAFVIARLAPRFRDDELEAALADLAGERLTRPTAARTADLARRIAACSYEVEFPPETTLAERVLWPQSPCESHGIEDARFVRRRRTTASTARPTPRSTVRRSPRS